MLPIKMMMPVGWKTSCKPLVCSRIYLHHEVEALELNLQEAQFLLAILEGNRQTALQLLAADHFYQPHLLPRLRKVYQILKKQQKPQQAS